MLGMRAVIIIHTLVAIIALPRIALRHRNPTSAAAWWLLILSIPFIGWLIYLLCGRDGATPEPMPRGEGGYSLRHIIESGCSSPVSLHSRVEFLHDAQSAFSSILAALHRARRSINIGYYIILDDRFGRTLLNILRRKSRAGVKVRLYYDGYGSRSLSRSSLRALREAGVHALPFNPVRFPWFSPHTLRRNHRKILVIDDRVGFLGGLNIASYYLSRGSKEGWRDEHLRIEGEAVGQLQRLFLHDWLRAGGEPFMPQSSPLIPRGEALQLVWAGDGFRSSTLLDAILSSLYRANDTISICSPYFMPPPEILTALRVASSSGVRVRVLLPRSYPSGLLNLVAESYFVDLLNAGAELYLYGEGFMHAKYFIVDNDLAGIGTANMDYRSLMLNLEVVAFIYDQPRVREQAAIFERDIKKSRQLLVDDLKVDGIRAKVGSMMRLISPQL